MSRCVLAKTSFMSSWPSTKTVHLYERAAQAGNFEATIKLGIASLYGEGGKRCRCKAYVLLCLLCLLRQLTDSETVQPNPQVAGNMLSHAEHITNSAQPFVWLLFRPPWSSESCSKAQIFVSLRDAAEDLVVRPDESSAPSDA